MKKQFALIQPVIWILLVIGGLSLLNVGSTLYVPTITASLLNDGVLKGNVDYIYSQIPWMLGAAMVTVLTATLNVYLSAMSASRIGQHLRQRLTDKIESFTMSDFNRFGTGTLTIRLTHDVEKLQSVLGEAFTMVLPMPLMIMMGLVLTFKMNVVLGYIVIVVMALVVASTFLIQYLSMPYVRQVQVQLDRIADLVKEHITGMRVIRAFNRGAYEQDREYDAFEQVARRSVSMSRLYSFMLPAILLVFNISSVILIWVGGYQVEAGHIEVGQIIAVVEYALQILLALTMSVFVFMDVPEAIIGYKRIQEVLDFPVTDVATLGKKAACETELSSKGWGAVNQEVNPKGNSEYDQAFGQDNVLASAYPMDGEKDRTPILALQNVSFRYDDAEMPALQDVSFNLYPGQSLAIMGDIGCGKSTLVNVIMGLAAVEAGQVLLEGQSMYDQSLDSVRQRIAYVPQKAFLFTGTIKDNLLHGLRAKQEGGLSLEALGEAMDRACTIADAYDFVHAYSDGYDHEVVQGGSNLSGGQRQRLAMARALMRQADLYIFDDSFSALDGTTEKKVRASLRDWLSQHSHSAIISIEQKVSSAKSADAILVLDKGKVVGYGKHEELLANCPVYGQIVASQEVAQ